MAGDSSEELLAELALGPAQGRRAAELQVTAQRPLRASDLPALALARAEGSQLLRLRHSHHQLAQGLAQGLTLQAVALSSGYDPAYICTLQRDPSFAELVEYYREQREQALVDVLARMRQLGLDVVDEIQARLAEDPSKFSLRELNELCELMLVKSGHVGKQQQAGPGTGAPLALQINFVQGGPAEPEGQGPLLEGKVEA